MATAVRTKENHCDFTMYKTPIRTPVRSEKTGSMTINDLSFYSNNNQHIKYAGTTNITDLRMYAESMGTPIRLNKNRFITPASIQRRQALALVNQNSHPLPHWPSSDETSARLFNKEINAKQDDSVVLEAPASKMNHLDPDDDLPHSPHIDQDHFDDLIPTDERIERLMVHPMMNGVNMFAFTGAIENSVRCQSPMSSRLDLSTLLDILD